jgi:hypothetical protein
VGQLACRAQIFTFFTRKRWSGKWQREMEGYFQGVNRAMRCIESMSLTCGEEQRDTNYRIKSGRATAQRFCE